MNFTPPRHHDTYPAIQNADHRGRAVLATGASRGIGRAAAVSFARAGASAIAIAARTSLADVEAEVLATAELAGHAPPRVLKLDLDVTDDASVARAAAETTDQFRRLDVLVNNAGYLETWLAIAESNPSEWWKSWEVNVKGVYLVTRAFLPLLLKSEQKTIVNVTSIGALRTEHGASAYQSTKFALLKFTEFVNAEYGSQGVIAFAMHPGGVPTDLARGMPERMHHVLLDTPALAGDTIAWLTQGRKEWLAGRYVSANWDMPEVEERREEIVGGDKLKMKMVF
jgi:NAD(P)-dependent dehydrogenase (short-subunit alcohol dehydrogenase family)